MTIVKVRGPDQIEEVRRLFREYERLLGVDLCFQHFEQELADLPGKYAPPGGTILLAQEGERMAGCVALRKLAREICEMKRLFVRPEFRRRGLGKILAEAIIKEAIELGYKLMRLDTLERLDEAMNLYESLGFRRIPAYYDNPLPGVVYWEIETWSRHQRSGG
jgi:GNAT superfamily N-acetyltransferase